MNDLVSMRDGQPMVSSDLVAKKFERSHRDVLKSIAKTKELCSDSFWSVNFHTSVFETRGKEYDCYTMTKDGFSVLVMGFNGKKAMEWKERYIAAFNAMEDALTKTPITMDELNDLVKRIEGNKECASVAGRALQSYRKIKQQDADDFQSAVNQAQLALEI